jgi:hypothetical protein
MVGVYDGIIKIRRRKKGGGKRGRERKEKGKTHTQTKLLPILPVYTHICITIVHEETNKKTKTFHECRYYYVLSQARQGVA